MILFSSVSYVAVDFDNSVYAYSEYPQWDETQKRWNGQPLAYLGCLGRDQEDIPEELRGMTFRSEPHRVWLHGRVEDIRFKDSKNNSL